MFREQNDFGNLKEIGKLYHIEGDFENMQKEFGDLENLKNVADFEEEEGIVQLRWQRARNEEFARQNKEIEERNRKWGSDD